MKFFKRFTALCLSTALVFSLSACGDNRDKTAKKLNIESYVTLNVWYNDDTYTDYLNKVAQDFHKANELVTIQPQLVSSDDYLSELYDQSVNQNNPADIYMMSSDDMQKAFLMGMLTENTATDVYTDTVYGKAGIQGSSYKGKLYGYPISFNTSFMVYNKKYATAKNTFTEISDFANSFTVNDENQGVQRIIAWDVSSMFVNYGFVAPYIDIQELNNSSSPQESCRVKISPVSIKYALNAYFHLKDTYGIDRSEVTTQSCIDDFKDGKLLYTIIDANNLAQLADSNVDYSIIPIPSLGEGFETNAISETTMAIVNPFSKNAESARAVAKAISYDYVDQLPAYAGRLPARSNLKFKRNKDNYASLYQIYADSVPKSGVIATAELYMRYEIMIHQIWDGKNVDEAYNVFESFLNQLNK